MKIKITFLVIVLFAIKLTFAAPPTPPEGYKWRLVDAFSDEFNGTSLDKDKWYDYNKGWEGRPPAKFVPEAITVSDGTMKIKNEVLDTPDRNYTLYGGAVTSKNEQATYGYYECRFKASLVSMSTTFWLTGTDRHPVPDTECGNDEFHTELDIVECIGGSKTWPAFKTSMNSNTHFHYWPCDGGDMQVYSKSATMELTSNVGEDFHTYGAWFKNPREITFYTDDVERESINFRDDVMDQPFSSPMKMNMLTETYDWEPAPTHEELADDSRNTSYYDWVRTWELVPDVCNAPEDTIEAENWESMSGVQTESTSDIGGGINVGWIEDGDWVDYCVDIPAGGNFSVELRIASPNETGQVQILLDNELKTTIDIPATGGWQAWQTLETEIFSTSAGKQTLRVLASVGGFNFNWLILKKDEIPLYTLTVNSGTGAGNYAEGSIISIASDAAPTGQEFNVWTGEIANIADVGSSATTITMPASEVTIEATYKPIVVVCGNNTDTTIEAESYDAMFGVQTETCSEGGLNVGWIDAGDWMEYCINIPADGNYEVDLRLATLPNTGIIEILIDGVAQTSVDVPATDGWQAWATATSTQFNITAGTHTLRLNAIEMGFNINWLLVKTAEIVVPEYSLTVNSGNGDGDYEEGSVVSIVADAAPGGQEFDSWTGDVANVADVSNASTTITMPASAASVTATYITIDEPCSNTIGSTIEAEAYNAMSGIQTEPCSEGGENVGWIDVGDWMEYCINIPADGIYEVDLRLASEPNTGTVEIQINDIAQTSVNVPVSGGWQNWVTTTSSQINLTSGMHTLKLNATEAGFNINWIVVNEVTTAINLVQNFDFETGDLTSWSPWGAVSVINDDVFAGKHSVTINGSGAAEQYITVKPNTTYTLSAYGKVAAAGQDVNLGIKEYGGAEISVPITSTTYQQSSLSFTTGASDTQAKFYFYCGNSSYQAYGDDFEVVSGTKSANSSMSELNNTPSFKVYPMPINGANFMVELDNYSDVSTNIKILDIQGKKIYQESKSAKTFTISADIFTYPGMYFIQVSNTFGMEVEKIIVK